MRQRRVLLTVVSMGIVLVFACVVWAIAVQRVVPNVCSLAHPPAHAGYVDCPIHLEKPAH
jgi:uncharacterized membrane protein